MCEELKSAANTVLQGRIITAMPLSKSEQQHIAKRFEAFLGQQVQLSCQTDEAQLSGIRVEVGGFSYDGTLRSQLQDLLKMLTSSEKEE